MDYIKEISPEQAVILWQESRLSLSRCYEKAPEILKVHGSVIGTLGNFSASIGKAKSKKTFNVSAIVAAALKNGTVLRYAAELPEEKRKVLYIDTEQSPYHCLKVMKRILRMAGLPDDRDSGYLEFLALRKYTPEQRISIVEQAIYHSPDIGLVIIDGIRDMVYDINSPGESTRIISKLMQWTDDRQIHIHTILHQNKGDENARGHIGTELNNKAETVLLVEKDKGNSDISHVSAMHIRAMDFEPFAF
ncbi:MULTISPECIES: AAA family ATPase, partial [Bacteroidaceae]